MNAPAPLPRPPATPPRCLICDRAAHDPAWQLLARRARYGEAIWTWICPGCTASHTGTTQARPAASYRARACAGPPPASYSEGGDGERIAPDASAIARLHTRRAQDLCRALELADQGAEAAVLHVGCEGGETLAATGGTLSVRAVGLEPWLPWRRQAQRAGLEVVNATLEDWDDERAFDVVVEHDLLPYLADPLTHLRRLVARVRPHGVVLVEVPNLLGQAGGLEADVLRADQPLGFTPRALVSALRRSGLEPLAIEAGTALRVWARLATQREKPTPGPSAVAVTAALLGNDLRGAVKRALARCGPTQSARRAAARVHRQCPWPAARADIAIEIATACERCSDYGAAEYWLRTSLADRHDPEVLALLHQLLEIRDRCGVALAPATAATTTTAARCDETRARLAS